MAQAPPAEPGEGRDWPPPEARQAWSQEMQEARYGDYGPERDRARMDGDPERGQREVFGRRSRVPGARREEERERESEPELLPSVPPRS